MIIKHLSIAVVLPIFFMNSAVAAQLRSPNVILILADDLGIGNVGCYGSDNYKTPHIDQLARTGIRFEHAFTASLCGPSRALIMTGRYAFRNGSTNQDACGELAFHEIIMPRLFKAAGYKTSCVGKWGQLPGEPLDHGFDDYLRFNGSGVYRSASSEMAEPYSVNGQDKKLGMNEYMPDVCQDHVVSFIRKHRDDPFFIYYPMSHVHGELLPTPDSKEKVKDLMADNVAYMDKLVGDLIDELDSLKLRENTLVMFMGDNGTGKGQADKATIRGRSLSGMKGTMLECGGRVPLIASWPAKMPPGQISRDLVDSTDLLPTFAELIDQKLPAATVFDGVTFAALLLGEQGKKREWIFNQLAAMWYVRDSSFKLNHLGELYDMNDAPFSETLIPSDTTNADAIAARVRLAAVLEKLNPAGGILDTGDGTGRHANKVKKSKK